MAADNEKKKKKVEVDPTLTLEKAIEGYLHASKEINAWDEEKARCKATIDKALQESKDGKVVTAAGYAVLSPSTRKTLDKALVEKIHNITIGEECYKVTNYTQTKVFMSNSMAE